MAKNIYSYLANLVCENLSQTVLEVNSVEEAETEKKDSDGKLTGISEKFFKFTVEAPRGNGYLSKIPFSVKIPMGLPKFDVSVIDSKSIFIKFIDLELTYIDTRRNVYFRASDYEVVDEVEFEL